MNKGPIISIINVHEKTVVPVFIYNIMENKTQIIKELSKIPGVGTSIANDLYLIGIRKIEDLRNKNPEDLFNQSNQLVGCVQDRCLLYVFRCAVYYAETEPEERETEKLLWWNWKN